MGTPLTPLRQNKGSFNIIKPGIDLTEQLPIEFVRSFELEPQLTDRNPAGVSYQVR